MTLNLFWGFYMNYLWLHISSEDFTWILMTPQQFEWWCINSRGLHIKWAYVNSLWLYMNSNDNAASILLMNLQQFSLTLHQFWWLYINFLGSYICCDDPTSILVIVYVNPNEIYMNSRELYTNPGDPPKNGLIALWPNTRVVKCDYCVSQKRNEAK